MLKSLLIIHKLQKKRLLLGSIGIIIISSLFTQIYLQNTLINSEISSYLLTDTYSSPAVLFQGTTEPEVELDIFSSINEDINDIISNSISLKSSLNKSLLWEESGHHLSLDYNNTENILCNLAGMSETLYNISRSIVFSDYVSTLNQTNPTENINDVEGFLILRDSKIIREKTIKLENLSITNDLTNETNIFSVLTFSLTDLNQTMLNQEGGIYEAYMTMQESSTTIPSESTLLTSDSLFKSLYSSNFINHETGIIIYLKLILFQKELLSGLFNSTSYYGQINQEISSIENIFLQKRILLGGYNDLLIYKGLIDYWKGIFLLIQVIIEIPLLLFAFFSFYLLQSKRDNEFEDFLSRLFTKGKSRVQPILYLLSELIIIFTLNYILGGLIAIGISAFSIMLWDPSLFASKSVVLLEIYYEFLLNFEMKIIFLLLIILLDFKSWRKALFYFPNEINFNRNLLEDQEINNKTYKIRNIPILIFITVVIAILSSMNLNSIDQSLVPLVILFALICFAIFIKMLILDVGLIVCQKICRYLGEKLTFLVATSYLLIVQKNKQIFIGAQIIAIVSIVFFSSTYSTMKLNADRNSNYLIGTDIRIDTTNPYNQTYFTNLEGNIDQISQISAMNRTVTTLGTEFSNYANVFSIMIVDPQTYFDVAYLENGFFEKNTVNNIKEYLSVNNNVIVAKPDIERINNLVIDEKIEITGYSNSSRTEKYQWSLQVVDTYEYWPSVKPTDLDDTYIQIIVSYETFSMFQTKYNLSLDVNSNYWIKLKPEFKNSIESIVDNKMDILSPVENKYAVFYIDSSVVLEEGFNSIFLNNISLAIIYISIISIQSYFIVITFDLFQRKKEFGIFQAIGLSKNGSFLGYAGYLFASVLLVSLSCAILTIILLPFFMTFLSTIYTLPIKNVVDFHILVISLTILFLLSGLVFLYKAVIKQSIAEMIKFHE